MDKKTLRQYIKNQRDSMDSGNRALFSKTIMEKIVNLKSYKKAKTIMCFASFGSEVDTFLLINKILSQGKKLILPRVESYNNEKVLGLYWVNSPEQQLKKGVFGIMEPDPQKCKKANQKDIELYICPGVVFDKKCCRIGYGGGFYDRLLRNSDVSCLKIGIAFDLQVIESIDPEIFDMPMDMVITENADYKVSEGI